MRDTLTYVNAGKLAPIPESVTELIQPEAYGTAEDGNVYTVPYSALNGEIGLNIVYNKDYFEENDLEVPETYDDFLDLLDDIKANGDAPLATAAAEVWPSDQLWKPLAAPYFAECGDKGGFWTAAQNGDATDRGPARAAAGAARHHQRLRARGLAVHGGRADHDAARERHGRHGDVVGRHRAAQRHPQGRPGLQRGPVHHPGRGRHHQRAEERGQRRHRRRARDLGSGGRGRRRVRVGDGVPRVLLPGGDRQPDGVAGVAGAEHRRRGRDRAQHLDPGRRRTTSRFSRTPTCRGTRTCRTCRRSARSTPSSVRRASRCRTASRRSTTPSPRCRRSSTRRSQRAETTRDTVPGRRPGAVERRRGGLHD